MGVMIVGVIVIVIFIIVFGIEVIVSVDEIVFVDEVFKSVEVNIIKEILVMVIFENIIELIVEVK